MVDEIVSTTNTISFYLYNPYDFMAKAQSYLHVSVKQKSIEQVRDVSQNESDLNSPEDYDNLTDDNKSILQNWIKGNVEPARKVCNRTSYGMKHVFEREDYGFYITNGQFKGAMLEAGHLPVDPNELNWRFKIHFQRKPKRYGAKGSFYRWLRKQKERDDFIGDLARDALQDDNWPVETTNFEACMAYLETQTSRQVIYDTLEEAWAEWETTKV